MESHEFACRRVPFPYESSVQRIRREFGIRDLSQLGSNGFSFTLVGPHPPDEPLGGEHFCCRNLHFNGSPKKLKQNSNPVFHGQQISNQDLQSLKRPLDDLNRLANFNGGIDSDNFFRAHSRLKADHNIFRQSCKAIPKVDDASDSV